MEKLAKHFGNDEDHHLVLERRCSSWLESGKVEASEKK